MMRAPFQDGDFPGPVKYGYLSVGVVEDGAAGAARAHRLLPAPAPDGVRRAGRRRSPSCPTDVPARRAVLAGIVETAVNALWDAAPLLGDRVAVVGAGTRRAAAWPGCSPGCPGVDVTLVDVDPARAAVARALGVGLRLPDDAAGGRDLVVHTSATSAGLQRSLDLLAPEGTVVELSWYGDADDDAVARRQLPLRPARRSGPARSARSRRRGAAVGRRRTGSRSPSTCCATRRSTRLLTGRVAVRASCPR